MPDAKDVERVFEEYAAAWSRRDMGAVVALFSPDAVVHDPVDGPGVEGQDKIRAFFAEFGAPVRAMRLAGPVHISADCRHAAARVDAEVDLGEGATLVESLDVFTFDDDGRIATMNAYWGPTNFHSR
jgi:steroid delta-isomerase